jgi:hypothetical protein
MDGHSVLIPVCLMKRAHWMEERRIVAPPPGFIHGDALQ